ncbi:MauE/DoxX family redox-associated membrane protein [Flavobacterium panici]|uniref:Methylamine utilisation protein MauE domain-containing protein n=1 Tax=Flavobacterium panici TaxID=2654843 RepID=A0A9N8J1B0_9FLAO|nr:MauE/DoxX family redox-associated membrane protein [Flavobacterium panici]CAC9974406.1 hypothetical protein FLAPXU55_02103 [Flavobacterium panici]
MNLNFNKKSVFVQIVCLLFILLFVYAAVSKLLDFENFTVQLAQSPLLSAHASWVSIFVPAAELFTVLLLLIPRHRIKGLYCCLNLMIMFTVYIFIVLHYSSFVPCSCGGVLAKMSWNAHLLFNILFVVLAILAIAWKNCHRKSKAFAEYVYEMKWIGGSFCFSVLTVLLLFLSSEKIMHNDNPFIRRYPIHPAEFIYDVDLKFNSYYFSGSTGSTIYLGNFTSPSRILAINENNKKEKIFNITFDPKDIPFRAVTIAVRDSTFYLSDGSVPAVFSGRIKDWKITNEFKGVPYFTKVVPLDSKSIVFRSNNAKNSANVLGIFDAESNTKIQYKRNLLQGQIDGIFDTDGSLLYSSEQKKIIYLYLYRNEFIVADRNGDLSYRGHTIDTIKHVKIKVASIKNDMERMISSPSYPVNAKAAVCSNLLFVNSKIKGRFENSRLWEQSYIIDVYDIKKNIYLLSFPVYHTGKEKLSGFLVTPTNLYALIGNRISVYKLNEAIKKEMQPK